MRSTSHPFHETLELRNFTAFSDAKFEFSKGVNAFIGENGAGKTHVLKALFAWQLSAVQNKTYGPNLWRDVYQVDSENSLVRLGDEDDGSASGQFGGNGWHKPFKRVLPSEFYERSGVRGSIEFLPTPSRPVFIPAVDMMGHTRAFLSTYDLHNIDFDLTHRDIVGLLLSPEKRELEKLTARDANYFHELIGGKLELDGERFYIETVSGRIPMPLIAEGIRRIATLFRLYQGGWLGPGAVLFWDEPEVNLNPILMEQVVQIILDLARQDVQVFLATHSYVILKELDLQARVADKVRFFSLETNAEGTSVNDAKDFAQLQPNRILDEYGSLFDRDIKRASKGSAR